MKAQNTSQQSQRVEPEIKARLPQRFRRDRGTLTSLVPPSRRVRRVDRKQGQVQRAQEDEKVDVKEVRGLVRV